MANMSTYVPLEATQNKMTEYRHKENVAFQLLVQSQAGEGDIDLKEPRTYHTSPVYYNLVITDGYTTRKTGRSAVSPYLTKEACDA